MALVKNSDRSRWLPRHCLCRDSGSLIARIFARLAAPESIAADGDSGEASTSIRVSRRQEWYRYTNAFSILVAAACYDESKATRGHAAGTTLNAKERCAVSLYLGLWVPPSTALFLLSDAKTETLRFSPWSRAPSVL